MPGAVMLESKRVAALRLLGFIAAVAVALPAAGMAVGIVSSMSGEVTGRLASTWLFPLVFLMILAGVTWAACRLERTKLDSLGIALTQGRAVEFLAGFLVAALVFAVVAWARAISVGAEWTFNAATGVRSAVAALPLVLLLVLAEELLFRGYAFRKACVLWGGPVTLIVSSLLFGLYHLMWSSAWGMGALFLFAMPAVGGAVFGLAALRTNGLALPVGLHLGGNWVGGSVLGLGVPEGGALWTASVNAAQASWLLAPDIVPRLPYLVGVAALAVLLACWPPRRYTP
jgi:uncharacterized protein